MPSPSTRRRCWRRGSPGGRRRSSSRSSLARPSPRISRSTRRRRCLPRRSRRGWLPPCPGSTGDEARGAARRDGRGAPRRALLQPPPLPPRAAGVEAVWHEATPEDRGFLEGLIQIAGGLHLHTCQSGPRGAVHLLSQALITLEDYRPAAHGIDVEALVADADAFVGWLKRGGEPQRTHLRLPRLRPAQEP